jgi:uridine kinase
LLALHEVALEVGGKARALRRPIIVGISGIECAGKSSFAALLAEYLENRGSRTYVAAIDDFLNPKTIRYDGSDLATCYYEKTFRTRELLQQVVHPVFQFGAINNDVLIHDYETDLVLPRLVRTDRLDVLIVEGVFLFRNPLVEHLDLKVWLEISFEDALSRARGRQTELMRYGSEKIAHRYRIRYFPAQQRHLDVDRPREAADLIIDAMSLDGARGPQIP